MLLNRPLFVAIALAIASAAPSLRAQTFQHDVSPATHAQAPFDDRVAAGSRLARMALDPSLSLEDRHQHALAAVELLSPLVADGDATAAWHLGSLHAAGGSGGPNMAQAVPLIRQAAEAGQPAAAFWMAQHPASPVSGQSVQRVRYLSLAAYSGHVSAMHLLAAHYADRALDAQSTGERRSAHSHRQFWLTKEAEHSGSLRPVEGHPSSSASAIAEAAPAAPATPVAGQRADAAERLPTARHVASEEVSSADSVATVDAHSEPAPLRTIAQDHDPLRMRREAACTHADGGLRIPGVTYEEGAACGDPEQQTDAGAAPLSGHDLNRLGLEHYELGEYPDAAAYFHRAARAGSAAGMTNFALLLMYGRGVDQDARRAVKLLHKADALGNAAAALNLGQLHARGAYVERNEPLALHYFRRAEALGSDAGRSAKIQLMRRTGLQ